MCSGWQEQVLGSGFRKSVQRLLQRLVVAEVVVVVVGGTRSNRRSRLLLPHLVEALVAAGHSGATRHLLKSPTETWKGRQKETQTHRHIQTHIEIWKGRLEPGQAEGNSETHK